MASYHERPTPHQVNMETPQSYTQYPTSQPLSIATTEAVRARMGLDSLDHTYGSSGQMYDTEKESWRGIWKRTSRKSIESVTIALNAQKRALLDMMYF
ncbi:hypothetical protein FOWG_14830 [Fusarium oxysporum f. sp. lycopersici MN25]|nr:hypothetical protein FOWG_14830 [Fusarium oxysporum f. sp. lycopersici MN25]